MNITNQQQEHLYKAFGLFIEAFRYYVVEVLTKEFDDRWPAAFVESLYPAQRDTWNLGIKSGSEPETLIDFQYLKSFALKYKDLLKADFGRETNKLATRLETIYDSRNKLAHFQELTEDDFAETFIQMKNIARSIKMHELEEELVELQSGQAKEKPIATSSKEIKEGKTIPWFQNVIPHPDIRQGRLDESVFAANLAEVALGNGREIYNNPVVFFSKTYFTSGLKNVARTVIRGLNGTGDADNRVINLQTGFGGGKTHTLISLFHICKWGKRVSESSNVRDLIAYTGKPEFDSAKIAVFTNTTNDPANGRKIDESITIHTIWGELAYQLGGKDCYEIIRKNDEQLIAPGGLFKQILQKTKPALILIDELADYCVKASARKAGSSSLADQTISFMQELTEAIAGTNHCVAVITLPASPQEVGNTPEAQAILSSLQKRVSRVGADTQPVADDEVFEVIRRRLFEDIGSVDMIEQVVSKYMDMYQQYRTELPAHVNTSAYKQRLLKSYPFHPELIDVFRIRWASNSDFQRTRGVLRLLAAIVSDLWMRRQSLPGSNLLIHSGQINFSHIDALSGQLKKLYGNGYDAVITADVSGASSNACKIDNNKQDYGRWHLTEGIASVILLNSFGSEGPNKGVSVSELKLNLLIPDGYNHNSINGALDELEGNAYYLYYAQAGGSGKRYWFHTKPNINILINQAKADIKSEDVESQIIRLIKEKTNGRIELFQVIVDPSEDIPEQLRPTLVILSPKYLSNGGISKNTQKLIEKIATKKGNSERIYRNTILFLTATEIGIARLQSSIRDYLACTKISRDYQSQLETEQKADLKKRTDDALKQSEVALAAAYSNIFKFSVKNEIELLAVKQFSEGLDSQINKHVLTLLKDEEWLLESVGLNTLKNNNLLPNPDNPVRVKDIYEAFIRFDDKPMIIGKEAVARSIQRYCTNGEFAVATGDGREFTRIFYKENIPFLDVDDSSYWVVDRSLKQAESPTAGVSTPEDDKLITTANEPDENKHDDNDRTSSVRRIKSLTISGKVPLESYSQIFTSFLQPLMHNHLEIEVKIKAKSTNANPLTESSQVYKIVKESASQLGLNLEEEE